jgi:large subunit ribosomal protein L30
MAKEKAETIRIKYVRSAIGRPRSQGLAVKSLGFRKLNQIVERQDTPGVRGLIAKIGHLVQVVDGDESS